jgi:2-polyprenyl-3-methyl-5-hydroxy-6-metoxy-1,4-benzoquinol methylase
LANVVFVSKSLCFNSDIFALQNESSMKVKSPLTGSEDVQHLRSISVGEIKGLYKKILPEVEIAYIFKDLENIELYRCNQSGYEFFWPLDTCGDDRYYASLGKLPWYYMPWKWEHAACMNKIEEGAKVLEVGAAKGNFLKRLKEEKKADVVGLELNPKAETYGKENGVRILNQSIQEHALTHKDSYDVVCSFQVLEHISEVSSFLEAMITCLKPGGTLIISVPNNDSFIGTNRLNSKVLNLPPHHLGRWREASLRNLESLFAIKCTGVDKEPIQETHYETYVLNRFYDWFNNDFMVKVLWKLKITSFFKGMILKNKEEIDGHSINAYYTKN